MFAWHTCWYHVPLNDFILGSPHGYWNRIHWIRIPDTDSMWCCVSSTRHEDYARCAAGLELTHSVTRTVTQHSTQLWSGSRPCGGKVVFESRSPIRIGFGSKVPCGELHAWIFIEIVFIRCIICYQNKLTSLTNTLHFFYGTIAVPFVMFV